MANSVQVITYCVDMGLFVSVCVKDAADRVKYLAILDCGTIYNRATPTGFVMNHFKQVILSRGGVIDYLHISHFDRDHYNLLREIGEMYTTETRNKLSVNKMVYGFYGNKKPKQCLSRFYDYVNTPKDVHQVSNNLICKKNINRLSGGCDIGNNRKLVIRPIIYHGYYWDDNHIPVKGADVKIGDNVNHGSSIIDIYIENSSTQTWHYVFTGDSTYITLDILNNSQYGFNSHDIAWQVPHHGAQLLMCDKQDEEKIMDETLEQVKPKVVIVSALMDFHKKEWVHPYHKTMQKYCDVLGREQRGQRPIVCGENAPDGKCVVGIGMHNDRIFPTTKIISLKDWEVKDDAESKKRSCVNYEDVHHTSWILNM